MFQFIAENLATIIVAAVVLAIITAVVVKMIKDRKNGRSGCSGECGGCALQGECKTRKDADTNDIKIKRK